ncbi:Long-chain-fatty-acid--CoA ligase [bioreactor metagenome]|uniref:Long-chain-fatty-acid--CoA ligase n=1 Tax=bioreactor metagenome TaxID=1076179 RepID=A0A644YPM0_9ZZZZ
MSKLSDLFYQNADKYLDKSAIWCDGETATYQELSSLVSRYSNFLINHGVLYRDQIGIPMNNSIESVALIMAAADIGAGLVPINPTLPLSAIEAAFTSGNVKHLIARKSFYEKLEKAGSDRPQGLALCLDGEWEGVFSFGEVMKESVKRPVSNQVTGDETLILTMTSGSTGVPKPIELTQNNKLKRAFAHIELYGITKEDNILAATPLYHSLAERLVIIPLLIGATAVLLPRFTPILWLNCIKEQQVTFTIAVSAQLSQIAQLLSSPFVPEIDSLRCVVSSSALLEPHVRTQLIEKLQCDFHEMYGTSETSTVTNINFKEALHKQKSVGRCIPEADIRILRDNEEIADIGEIGEIACKTQLLFNGYYGLPDLTKQAFADGYFKTGDLGCLDEDGYLYFCGRKKELIITGGINVYPNDIDQCVMRLSDVAECAAFSYPDERLGEVVALAVVAQKDKTLSKRALQMHCAKHLADFQQPHYIFILDELPKNAMGKLMRSKIIEYTRIHNETL